MSTGKNFWDKMARSYDTHTNTKYEKAYEATISYTQKYLKNTDIILDYACGTGITTIPLSGNVKKIIAADTSEKMIEIAEKKALENKTKNIEFNVSTIFDESFEKKSFDAVLAFNILCYINEDEKLFKRILDLLKPGGLFISATDCYGDDKTFKTKLMFLLCRIGIFPKINNFNTIQLESNIKNSGFQIVETKNLYETPPNFYIVSKKPLIKA